MAQVGNTQRRGNQVVSRKEAPKGSHQRQYFSTAAYRRIDSVANYN